MAFPVLIVVCVLAFVATCLFAGGLRLVPTLKAAMAGPDLLTLIACGAKDRQLIVDAAEWWRLASAAFLHANIVHLAVNVYALFALGSLIETLWGTRRFLIIYIASAVGGGLLSLVATPSVSVGASGAVFGLFAALAVYSTVYRRFLRVEHRLAVWANLAVIAAINVALGLAVPFIDNAAHAGGFAAGGLLALVLRPVRARQLGREHVGATMLVHVASVAAVVVTVWSLGEACWYGWSADVVLVARGQMERRTVSGGDFSLFVPKGWSYEQPSRAGGRHVFRRDGVGIISVVWVPPRQAIDAATFAASAAARYREEGAEPVAQREMLVGDRAGVEVLLRRRGRHGGERIRLVVFPTTAGRVVHVTCLCAERRYRLLEILFDKVIQSIEPRLPVPDATGAQEFWQRLAEDPSDVEAYVMLAAHYRIEGSHAAAEQALRTAIKLQPRHADAHDQLAYLLATAAPPHRKPKLAVASARRALDCKPDTPRYLATLAIALEAAGEPAQALDAARKAAALAPDDATYADLVKRLSQGKRQE